MGSNVRGGTSWPCMSLINRSVACCPTSSVGARTVVSGGVKIGRHALVVEPHNGDLFRHLPPGVMQRLQHPHCRFIVRGKNGIEGCPRGEQLLHGIFRRAPVELAGDDERRVKEEPMRRERLAVARLAP